MILYINDHLFDFLQQLLTIAQPLLIGGLVNYFTSLQETPAWQGYLYAIGLSCSAFLITMIEQSYYFGAFRYGMQIRAALSAVIYNKVNNIEIG